MSLTKSDIFVTIDSEEKKQRAIEILEKHGEKIWEHRIAMVFDDFRKSLIFDRNDGWFVFNNSSKIEITLDQLDDLLTK